MLASCFQDITQLSLSWPLTSSADGSARSPQHAALPCCPGFALFSPPHSLDPNLPLCSLCSFGPIRSQRKKNRERQRQGEREPGGRQAAPVMFHNTLLRFSFLEILGCFLSCLSIRSTECPSSCCAVAFGVIFEIICPI